MPALGPRPVFHVLGAGSLGLLYAHHLRSASCPVTLLVRDPAAAGRFRAQGSQITLERTYQGSSETLRVDAQVEPVQAAGTAGVTQGPIRTLLVATKSMNVVEGVRSVQHRLGPDSSLVLMQNGVMAVYQELWREVLGHMEARPHVIIATTTHGAYLPQPFHLCHAGVGSTILAEVDPSLPSLSAPQHQRMWRSPPSPELTQLLDCLSSLGARRVDSHAALLRQLLTKLTVNCCINPLTALMECLNGKLATDEHAQEVMRGVCCELHQLFEHELGLSEQQLFDTVNQVAVTTAMNRSSMLQSITSGRTTEIEYLNGYVVQQGREKQVPTPINATLYHLIKTKERLIAK